MSLVPAQITDLVALGAPILCLDTCTILDVVRDITRETVRLADAKAGLDPCTPPSRSLFSWC